MEIYTQYTQSQVGFLAAEVSRTDVSLLQDTQYAMLTCDALKVLMERDIRTHRSVDRQRPISLFVFSIYSRAH